MSLRCLAPLVVAAFAGCVPVTEPLSDIAKSEPDKALLGEWTDDGKDKTHIVVDIPEVKGNPRGLMRAVFRSKGPPDVYWFFVAKVGKRDYIQLLVERKIDGKLPTFGKEGELAAWQKSDGRGYWIAQYSMDKDTLTIDGGRDEVFNELMKQEKFTGSVHDHVKYFATPAGWFAKYLEKNGPAAIFDGKGDVLRYKRIK